MNTKKTLGYRLKQTSCVGLLLVAGCVGVEGPGFVDVGVPGPPDVFLFGGWGRGHFDHDAGHRGFESRRAAGHFGGRGGRR